MKNILIAFLVTAVIFISACTTPASEAVEKVDKKAVSEKSQKDEKPKDEKPKDEKPKDEKSPVTKKVMVPYLVRETSYFSDGYIESYKVYTYNDEMDVVREDLFDSFDEIIESVVYEDLNESSVKKSVFDARGILQSWKLLKMDASGLVSAEESYNAEDKLQTVSEYSRDDMGRKISWKVYDSAGVVLSESKYLYEDGVNTRIEIYDASMKLREYFVKKYKDGLIISSSHYDEKDKMKASVEYEYNGGKLVVEKYLRANGSTSRIVKYTNDDNGSPVKIEYFDGNGNLKDWNEKDYEYVSEEITVWK